jgi:CubicO group peptidase (beta-lactamase class C family)
VTGKSLKQFVAEDICQPLGADFQLGAMESDWIRTSDVYPPEQTDVADSLRALDPSQPAFKTFTGPVPNAAAANTVEWRNADLGACNGHGNARSIVQILSTISLGGQASGIRLLSSKTVDRIFEEQANGVDLVLGKPLRLGIGYGLPCPTVPHIPEGRVCYWGGWGGSIIIMDVDKQLTIGYVMNKMSPETLGSERGKNYVRSIYDGVREVTTRQI